MSRLESMATFVRVVETGSFSEAARQLRTGQPAVSKAVAQLERRLGVRLLLRNTRRLAPTDAGQNFYERAKRVLSEADEAELAARGAAGMLTGRLRVSMGITLGRLHIVPGLASFLAAHPGWRAGPPALPLGTPRGTGTRLTPFHDGTDGFFIARLDKAC